MNTVAMIKGKQAPDVRCEQGTLWLLRHSRFLIGNIETDGGGPGKGFLQFNHGKISILLRVIINTP